MPDQSWLSLFGAALGGGVTVKVLDIGYQEYRVWKGRQSDDKKTIDDRLEPLLRAADELVGKLRSLAEQDFIPIRDAEAQSMTDTSFSSVIYLFVQFWSEVEIVRFRGLSTSVARSQRGKQTQAFLTCLESRRVRLIDRISQRALGEALHMDGKTMNFVAFIKSYETDPYMQRWLKPLFAVLAEVRHTDARQRILQYATIIHTLDHEHAVTRDRPAAANKLNTKSWRDLNYRVFGVYLKFVADRDKYIGPPKRRP